MRIVLQVAIHGDHVVALGMVKSGGQCGRLSEIAAQLDYDHPAVHRGDLLQQRERIIAAAVVHENQLEGFSGSFHDHPQAVVQLGYVLFFVVKRYDD